MSDVPPEAIEVGKVAGSGGLGFLAAKFLDRWFTRADKDAGKLDQVLAVLAGVNGKLDVMTERVGATRADVDKLEAAVLAIQLQLATLQGKFEHLSEQLAK